MTMIRRENAISVRAAPRVALPLLPHTAVQQSPYIYGARAALTIRVYPFGKQIPRPLHSLNHQKCLGVLGMLSQACYLLSKCLHFNL